jgi:GMP synthase PP-ATPase subunit
MTYNGRHEARPTHCYTGTLLCDCIVAVVVDEPEHSKDTAKDVAEFIRHGYRVDRRALIEVKADPTFLRNCGGKHHTPERRRRAAGKQIEAGL